MPFQFRVRPLGSVVPAIAVSALAVSALALTAAAPAVAQPVAGTAQPAAATGWRVVKTFPKYTNLDTIVPLPGKTAWAGGQTPGQLPAVYHLAHGKWQRTTLPGSMGSFVNQISATSSTNVWASLANTPAVEHLTSKGWVAHTFAIGADEIMLDGVVTLSPKDTFVFAYDFATMKSYSYHYNGTKWIRKSMPAAIDANSDSGLVSGTSYSNIWGLTIVGGKYAALWFNGHKWRIEKFPAHLAASGSTAFARQILAVSRKNVWVPIFVNASTNTTTSVGPVVLLHWNGTKWTKVGGKAPKGALSGAVASDGNGGVWLAANNTAFTKALLMHFAHGTWSEHAAPTPGGQILGITALAGVPGTRSVLGTAAINPGPSGNAGSVILKYGK